jgi:hypothetical protein
MWVEKLVRDKFNKTVQGRFKGLLYGYSSTLVVLIVIVFMLTLLIIAIVVVMVLFGVMVSTFIMVV